MGDLCSKKTNALSPYTVSYFPDLEPLRLDATEVKVIRKIAHSAFSTGEAEATMLSHEILIMSRLVHPCIVRFIGCTWTTNDDLSVVTEYMDGGDVLTLLKTCKADLSWRREKISIAIDIASSLAYLHSQRPKVVYRDLRTRNVLLSSDMVAKLSDFELARTTRE